MGSPDTPHSCSGASACRNGLVVIGQERSVVILIEDGRIIDGRSLEWASEFVTRKVGRYAHLDADVLAQNKAICVKYAKPLAENLSYEIGDVVSTHGHAGAIIVSGGGILIPGVRRELEARLKGMEIVVPKDPVMSNAQGLYMLAREN